MTALLIAIGLSILYAALVEYAAHRWLMHFPGLGKGAWWNEHAIQHHGHSRNDVNITLSAATVTMAASPLFGFCGILGWPWASVVLIGTISYAELWSLLHAAYHEVGDSWVSRTAIYQKWKTHHLLHHRDTSKNFGTVFIWTDVIFGTSYSETR